MIANPHRGEVSIALGPRGARRRRYLLRPTFQAMAEIEAATGRDLDRLAQRFLAGEATVGEVAAVVAAGLKAAGGPDDPDEVAELVFRRGILACCQPAAAFVIGALSGGAAAEEMESEPGEALAAKDARPAFPSAAISAWRWRYLAGAKPTSGPRLPSPSAPR